MKPNENELAKLREHVERERTTEQNALKYIKQYDDLDAQLRILWGANEAFALEAFFLNGDLNQAKLHFFRCARTDEVRVRKFDSDIADYATDHCAYTLLCDDSHLLRRYVTLGSSLRKKSISNGYTLIPLVQAFLKKDKTAVAEVLEIAGKKTIRKWKHTKPEFEFLSSCAKKSKKGMLDGIAGILEGHRHRKKHLIYSGELLSPAAICYAKLSWILGFELEVDHPLVPMELLPVKSLLGYQDYDFLKGLP